MTKHSISLILLPMLLFSTTAMAGIPEWSELILSGATFKTDTKIKFNTKSGIGWYWDEGINLNNSTKITVEFKSATTSFMYMQIIYNDTEVLSKKISSGTQSFTFEIDKNLDLANVCSINFISQTAHTADFSKVEIVEDGTAIDLVEDLTNLSVLEQNTYNAGGQETGRLHKGLNILRTKSADGKLSTKKIIIK
ncbi:MAG: hypothetical protein ACI4A7_04835 [Prevotella sp.]